MSLRRVKYGVEYDPDRDDGESSGAGWIAVVALLLAAVSLAVAVARRIASGDDAGGTVEIAAPVGRGVPSAPSSSPSVAPSAPSPAPSAAPPPAPAPMPSVEISDFSRRSARVKSLLMRLDEATKKGDLPMQVTTIETIRALPGESAADLASELVPRLGQLNRTWLFDMANPQWVVETEVRRGDSASRIAREHGSTLASFKRLNRLDDPDRISAGMKVRVMNHPRFNIVVRKRLRAVDLFLNGKLFARYLSPDSAPAPKCEPGAYSTPANVADFLRRMGVVLAPEDSAELDTLVPRDSPLTVTDS